jgi:Protein of unknown function (DUF4054)
MGALSNWPNYECWITSQWGYPAFEGNNYGLGSLLYAAANIVVGGNPPFTATDYLSIFPKFGGTPVTVQNCQTQANSQTIILEKPQPTLIPGNLVIGSGIPGGAYVLTNANTQMTISLPATLTQTGVMLSVYNAMFVPLLVINLYICMANGGLVQARWNELWYYAMCLYVDHFAVLWARSNGDMYCNAGAAAAAGLAVGIKVAKSAGQVSASMQMSTGLEGWGEWETTASGRAFATYAKSVGTGPMLIW